MTKSGTKSGKVNGQGNLSPEEHGLKPSGYRLSMSNLILGFDPAVPKTKGKMEKPENQQQFAAHKDVQTEDNMDENDSVSAGETAARTPVNSPEDSSIESSGDDNDQESDHETVENAGNSENLQGHKVDKVAQADSGSSSSSYFSSSEDSSDEDYKGRNKNAGKPAGMKAQKSGKVNTIESSDDEDYSTAEPATESDTVSSDNESSKKLDTKVKAAKNNKNAHQKPAIRSGALADDTDSSTATEQSDTDNDDKTASESESTPSKSVTFAAGTNEGAPSPDQTKSQPVSALTQRDNQMSSEHYLPSGATATDRMLQRPPSATGVNDWTYSEDAMIVSMKEQGASWGFIASSIRRTRDQVRKRYYEVKVAHANASMTNSPSNTPKQVESVPGASSGGRENETRNSGSVAAVASGHGGSDPDFEGEDGDIDEEEGNFDDEEDYYDSDEGDETDDSEDGEEESDGDDEFDFPDDESSSSSDSSDSDYDSPDYDPFADLRNDPIAWERECRRQERYMRRHVTSQLYASIFPCGYDEDEEHGRRHNKKRKQRDPFISQGFSRSDRKLLASLEDRRIATQWLEMQANFFNVTGRMVPLHFIKAKNGHGGPRCPGIGMGLGEVREGGKSGIDDHGDGEKKVEDWSQSVATHGEEMADPGAAGEKPADAMVSDDDECDDKK